MADSSPVLSTNDVRRARLELDRMNSALRSWLKFRTLNDAVAAGVAPTTKPREFAREVVIQGRDWAGEQRLANQLYVLLRESFPDSYIPVANVTADPNAAVKLALMAINGPGLELNSPTPQGQVWLWPVLIVGGLLLAVTTAIKTEADIQKDKEEKACITAGACTDYGFWLRAGGVAALAWVAWQMGLGDRIRGALKG